MLDFSIRLQEYVKVIKRLRVASDMSKTCFFQGNRQPKGIDPVPKSKIWEIPEGEGVSATTASSPWAFNG